MSLARGELFKDDYRAAVERLMDTVSQSGARESNPGGGRRNGGCLAAMRPFYDVLAGPASGRDAAGRPRIGYLCNLVPEELLLAANCFPVRLCSEDFDLAALGDKIIPAEICPLIKSVAGAFFRGEAGNLDLVVAPAACDGKTRIAELLNLKCPLHILDLPRRPSFPESVEQAEQSLAALWRLLKTRYGRRLSRRELLSACAQTNRRSAIFRRIFEFRAAAPGPITADDYFAMTSASFRMLPDDWTAAAAAVLAEAERRPPPAAGAASRKLLLAGSPIIFPNHKLLEITAESGGYIAADLLCSAYGRLHDPVVIDEETESGLIRSVAAKVAGPNLCPCYPGINKIADRMIDLAERHALSGVLYHQLRLCQLVDIQAAALRQILKERGIPALFIKTDFGREDRGQLKTRLEAFLEMMP